MNQTTTVSFIIIAATAIVIALIIIFPDTLLRLRTQVAPEIPTTVQKTFTWTPTQDGFYVGDVVASDDKGESRGEEISISVTSSGSQPGTTPAPSQPPSNDSGGGGGGSDGGDGGGSDDSGGGGGGSDDGGSSQPQSKSLTRVFQAESGHKIEGTYSKIQGSVVNIAGSNDLLSKAVTLPKDSYWLDITAKHDAPGPVDVAIYVNNRAWKVIRLDKGDDKYRTHRVGLLRNFSNATIRFRLLNDTYDKSDPVNEAKDRNLLVDWWRLTTENDPKALPAVQSGGVGGGSLAATGRSTGWTLLSGLNQFIRQELGNQFVTVDIWKYYAKRLTVPASDKASIQTEEHLRSVMRFWKGTSPARPRGADF